MALAAVPVLRFLGKGLGALTRGLGEVAGPALGRIGQLGGALAGKLGRVGQFASKVVGGLGRVADAVGGFAGRVERAAAGATGEVTAGERAVFASRVLTPYEKGLEGVKWSRAAALARGESEIGTEVDLVFTIGGRDVGIRADVLTQEGGSGVIKWIEAKFSPRASYTPNQRIVIPELVRAGDAGLVARVGARSGDSQRATSSRSRSRAIADRR